MKDLFTNIDQKVDRKVKPFWGIFKKYFPIFSATLLSLLLIFFILRVFHNKPYFASAIISSDLRKIVSALEKIDKDCSILSMDNVQNNVDFLNVKSFTGSEIGSLNLAYPKNWRGPYLYDNPTFKGKSYRIVKAKDGVFVIPGDGVKLPNGLIVGKDFKITPDSLISKMIESRGKLNYKGSSLAVQLKFEIGDWSQIELKEKEIEEISSVLKEFNEAMPFAHNQTAPYGL